ncbi:MAG: prolyl oligopeptidase family serine peptidase [Chloroflexi bacterium]|nr:prolyl oligopeptidase family serine peptidase [Chloroflexota bacterium]
MKLEDEISEGASNGGMMHLRTVSAISWATLAGAFTAAILTAAATAQGAAAAGLGEGALTWQGVSRSYLVYHPESLDRTRPAPLLLVLHGGGGTAENMVAGTGFDASADEFGFVAVYPEGIGHTWNAGLCCGVARAQGVDDAGFLSALVSVIAADQAVDPARIYATGVSNGGQMAYALACQRPDVFAAIGVVASTMDPAACQPRLPVSVVHIHGLADQNIPFAGGIGAKELSRPPIVYPSVPSAISRWRQIDGCQDVPSATLEGNVTISSASQCAAGTAVTLYTIAELGHAWPGGPRLTGPNPRQLDQPTNDIDASGVIWSFLQDHPKA